MLERAAVIGREFTAGAVNSLSGEQAVGSTLLSLVRRDLIEPDRSLIPGDDGFRFRHILIRDAAYLGVAKASRAELHERYADWLARSAGELDEIIGYHLEQAFRYRQELGSADDVAGGPGRRATCPGGSPGRRARRPPSRCHACSPAPRRSCPIRTSERREILPHPRQSADAHRRLRAGRARSSTRRSSRPRRRATERLELRTVIEREFFRAFTRPEESVDDIVAVADAAIPLLEELGDDIGLAKAWWLKSEVHLHAFRWAARTEHLERALEYARRAGDAGEQAAIAAQLAQAVYYGPAPVPSSDRAGARSCCATCLRLGRCGPPSSASARWAASDAGRLRRGAPAPGRGTGRSGKSSGIGSGSRCARLMAADIELLADRPEEATAVLALGVRRVLRDGSTERDPADQRFPRRRAVRGRRVRGGCALREASEEGATPVDVVAQVMWRVALARATADIGPRHERRSRSPSAPIRRISRHAPTSPPAICERRNWPTRRKATSPPRGGCWLGRLPRRRIVERTTEEGPMSVDVEREDPGMGRSGESFELAAQNAAEKWREYQAQGKSPDKRLELKVVEMYVTVHEPDRRLHRRARARPLTKGE